LRYHLLNKRIALTMSRSIGRLRASDSSQEQLCHAKRATEWTAARAKGAAAVGYAAASPPGRPWDCRANPRRAQRTAEPQPCAQPNGGGGAVSDQSWCQWVKLTIDHDGIAVPIAGSGTGTGLWLAQ